GHRSGPLPPAPPDARHHRTLQPLRRIRPAGQPAQAEPDPVPGRRTRGRRRVRYTARRAEFETGAAGLKPRLKVVRQESGLPREASGDEVEDITFAERIYRLLRRDLIAGEIAPGQSLRLAFLKQRYGSSFSPIREALNRLQSERMVVSTTSRGFRAASFSRVEMWDAVQTRILIDCEAMRRSLKNGDDAWETALVTAFHALTLAARRRHDLPEGESGESG